MLSKYGFKNKSSKVIVAVLIVVYIMLAVFLAITGRRGGVLIFGVASLSGILSGVQTVIAIGLTVTNSKFGGRAAIILTSISIVSAVLNMYKSGNVSALPGIIYAIACIIAIVIIMVGMKREIEISYRDRLTQISNRRALSEHIEHLVSEKTPFQLIYLSLDHFKYVNDTMGHEKGDEILKNVATLWGQVEVEDGHLGRMGGDEFVCIIPKKDDAYVDEKAKEFVDVLSRWLEGLHTLLTFTVSVGIASYPDNADSHSEVLRKADVAMYNAKYSGRNRICRYNASYDNAMLREQQIEVMVKEALADKRFYMVYQPQFVTSSHVLRGFEALIRMDTGDNERIGPGEFIPVAEKTDLIVDIGDYVINRVMCDFSGIVRAHRELTISINLSAKQILSPFFIDVVRKAMDDFNFPAECLEIEITEYCLMEATEEAISVINKLKRLGVKLAMDDFGTGYSSLSYLTRLPIDLIKIDKSLIDIISEGEIVKAIVTMGHTLGCEIISEGVEDEYQLDILNRLGCDYIQGYLWGKPISLSEASKLI